MGWTMTRLERALAIRDAALKWLPPNEQPKLVHGLRVVHVEVGTTYTVMLRTPFSGALPEPKVKGWGDAAFWQAHGTENLSYGLDVWERFEANGHRRIRKLMNLEWGCKGEVALVSFSTGEWDAAFLDALKEKAA
jgi:hypothetical protein